MFDKYFIACVYYNNQYNYLPDESKRLFALHHQTMGHIRHEDAESVTEKISLHSLEVWFHGRISGDIRWSDCLDIAFSRKKILRQKDFICWNFITEREDPKQSVHVKWGRPLSLMALCLNMPDPAYLQQGGQVTRMYRGLWGTRLHPGNSNITVLDRHLQCQTGVCTYSVIMHIQLFYCSIQKWQCNLFKYS